MLNIGITLGTYSHVLPGLHEAAAERVGRVMEASLEGEKSEGDVSKMLAKDGDLNVGPTGF